MQADTLLNILGTEPGTKAKALIPDTFKRPIWHFIEQHKNNHGELYWINYQEDVSDPVRHQEYDFKVIEFYYDINEPIWIRA